MTGATIDRDDLAAPEGDLKRSITGRLLYFYVLGDVLGSGIYVLIGLVAGAVGGAFWIAFAVGVGVATLTGLAYAELATKYPRAAGASLYVNQAFRSKTLTFLVTICILGAVFAAAGSLATGFASYFHEVWELPPLLLVSILFVVALAVVNYVGITESVVANLVMTVVEVAGLVIVMVIGIWYVAEGKADFGTLVDFQAEGNPVLAVIAGVTLAFFAMTGFENAVNVAEETVNPAKSFPRALVGGMITAGVIYVLVAVTAALTVPLDDLATSGAALLEVVEAGILPLAVGFMSLLFSCIAMVAITNTTLVSVVTQSRILYGMAEEGVVPAAFAKVQRSRRSPWVALVFSALLVCALLLVGRLVSELGVTVDVVARLATVTVVFVLLIYSLVIVSTFKLRGSDESEETFRAPTALLGLGLVGNLVLLGYVVNDDPDVAGVVRRAARGRPRALRARVLLRQRRSDAALPVLTRGEVAAPRRNRHVTLMGGSESPGDSRTPTKLSDVVAGATYAGRCGTRCPAPGRCRLVRRGGSARPRGRPGRCRRGR